MAVPAGSVA
nr:TPA_asm: m24.5 uORF [Murid betaherpesvirus 1]DBA07942.1 TPA_asm: m24.5 uORF [Murid betaherpesvirus 1]